MTAKSGGFDGLPDALQLGKVILHLFTAGEGDGRSGEVQLIGMGSEPCFHIGRIFRERLCEALIPKNEDPDTFICFPGRQRFTERMILYRESIAREYKPMLMRNGDRVGKR